MLSDLSCLREASMETYLSSAFMKRSAATSAIWTPEQDDLSLRLTVCLLFSSARLPSPRKSVSLNETVFYCIAMPVFSQTF